MAESRFFRIFIYILVLIFPVLSNLIPHTGSVVLVLLTLAGLPFCFSSKNRPQISGKEKAVMWAFTVFFAVYLFSFILNGLFGNLEDPRLKYLDHRVRLLFIIPIFFLLQRVKIEQKVLWYSVCAGAAVAGVYAVISRFWLSPGVRVGGSYHSIAFGDLTIVMAFMSLAAINFFRQKHNAYAVIPIAVFLLGAIASLLSGSKGAWIAFPAFAVIIFFYLGNLISIWPRVLICITACIVLFSAYNIPGTGVAERIQGMKKELSDYQADHRSKNSIAERMEGWKAAWNIFKQHPFTGAGVGNFKSIVLRMIDKGERSDIIARYSQPHSLYFYVMAECGIIGLLAILSVFIVPLWLMFSFARKSYPQRDIAYAGMILIIGFMHFGLTESIFGRNINIGFYVIMLAVVLSNLGIHAGSKRLVENR
ncbi:MAG: O-antigen ligase family protein [Deltaproteobacteria bacterium]|nr:O-antigen ligase family protein [Deltaproteobacteria bacterium]